MVEVLQRPPVRLSDVAKRAQCSAATVSRVLNAPESVNREARLRVEAAVRDLGYTRNGAARALRSRRSLTVGIVLPTLKLPIYADFIDGVQEVLARRNYSLIVTASDYEPERELRQARLLVERGIDGLVLIGHSHMPELFDLLSAQNVPFVTTYTFASGLNHPVIGFDNAAGMAKVVDYLFGLGHRDFAILAGSRRFNDRVEERVRGALAALSDRGLHLPPDRVVETELTIAGGRSGLRRLIDSGNRPTALMCTSDVTAYGVLIESRTQGIAVPRDLSVVGYDDLQSSLHVDPALTTLAIPADDMGRRAADHLLARFTGQASPDQVVLETRIVVRDTTAAPATAKPRG
jgi:LacI family transcriptional regulator